MEKEIIAKLHSEFEEIVQINNETGAECWFVRHSIFAWLCKNILQKCRTKRGEDHILDIRNMVQIGSGSSREINGIALTRYAC